MQKRTLFVGVLTLIFLVASCHSPSEQEVIQNLNGYWKIHKVKKKGEKEIREYKFSTSIDYIEVDSAGEGYRVKVKPQLDSTFKTTKDAEHFTLEMKEDSLRFQYETPMDSWTETLISSHENEFKVKNNRGITYTYKRFESLKKELEAHEEKK